MIDTAALYTAKTSRDVLDEASKIAAIIKRDGEQGIFKDLEAALHAKKDGLKREAALIAYGEIIPILQNDTHYLDILPKFLDMMADKGTPVREAAEYAANQIVMAIPPESTFLLIKTCKEIVEAGPKWQSMLGMLKIMEKLKQKAPRQVGECLVDIIEIASEGLHATKPEVSTQAYSTLTTLTSVSENKDIIPHLPLLIQCMANPDNVEKTISVLSATTFVAEVTAPTLAILAPVLTRGFEIRSAQIQRQLVLAIDNLGKLVRDPLQIANFLPALQPGVEAIRDNAAMPEVRALATRAADTLEKSRLSLAGAKGKTGDIVVADVAQHLAKIAPGADAYSRDVLSKILTDLANRRSFEKERWEALTQRYLKIGGKDVLKHFLDLDKARFATVVAHGEEEVVNTDFSLAYGGMMLLNHTNLTLLRGHKYGLCGHNGAGKSTLMRAIATGKLEGFPSKDEVKTCFVEHTLQGEEGDRSCLQYIENDPEITVHNSEIQEVLTAVGFDQVRQKAAVSSLSGGWKMKLELCRAMLMHCDILLLDEPTNHLDVANVAWLVKYLQEKKRITALIVSHDSGFLDNVCTDIIHYESRKLAYYAGNLSEFVKVRPEAKSYYTLSASNVKFAFPPPGLLTGVKSQTKAILRMDHVSFAYPGQTKKSLDDVSCALSLSSRVAIIGPNGAGKSTLIKLLTGETIPSEGKVDKHPNLRIGYVAQHAFHHVEQHMEKTPNHYIQWRYTGGEDREVLSKQSRALTEEEKEQMQRVITVDGEGRKIECLMGRQKLKKSYQYEIKWMNKLHKFNTWVGRELLIEHGFAKLVQSFDDYEASREGLGFRELTPAVIRKHYEDVGLPGDIADHNAIRGLSGGQKVKVVIAAAMWNNPHMLVLDEPTNYLDRDSLGGLAVAIRDWAGGVVMISHNEEFVGALCPEQWHVNAGRITQKGKIGVIEASFDDMSLGGSSGGRKKAKKPKMSRNDLKLREVRRRQRHLAWLADNTGAPKPADTDSDGD